MTGSDSPSAALLAYRSRSGRVRGRSPLFHYSDADVHHGSFPYTNVVLIGFCCLMFLYQLAVGGVGFLTGGGGVEVPVLFLK